MRPHNSGSCCIDNIIVCSNVCCVNIASGSRSALDTPTLQTTLTTAESTTNTVHLPVCVCGGCYYCYCYCYYYYYYYYYYDNNKKICVKNWLLLVGGSVSGAVSVEINMFLYPRV